MRVCLYYHDIHAKLSGVILAYGGLYLVIFWFLIIMKFYLNLIDSFGGLLKKNI